MERFYRLFLLLLMACLLVSAGGVAASQNLSAYLPVDVPAPGHAPVGVPYKERLEAASSIADRQEMALFRPVMAVRASQCQQRFEGQCATVILARRYPVFIPSFSSYYPQSLSPPPKRRVV